MRGIVERWLSQLWKLTVLWPAWLLTPDGRRVLFSRATLWRLGMALVFAAAVVAMAQTLPTDLALIGAADVTAYVEAAVVVWAAGASGMLRAGLRFVRRAMTSRVEVVARRERRATMRRRRPRRVQPPANDDGVPGGRWTVAA